MRFLRRVGEMHAVVIKRADDALDMREGEGVTQCAMAHLPADRVLQFGFLQIELRLRKIVPCADMIVVKVADDQIADVFCLDADHAQAVCRMTQE